MFILIYKYINIDMNQKNEFEKTWFDNIEDIYLIFKSLNHFILKEIVDLYKSLLPFSHGIYVYKTKNIDFEKFYKYNFINYTNDEYKYIKIIVYISKGYGNSIYIVVNFNKNNCDEQFIISNK